MSKLPDEFFKCDKCLQDQPRFIHMIENLQQRLENAEAKALMWKNIYAESIKEKPGFFKRILEAYRE